MQRIQRLIQLRRVEIDQVLKFHRRPAGAKIVLARLLQARAVELTPRLGGSRGGDVQQNGPGAPRLRVGGVEQRRRMMVLDVVHHIVQACPSGGTIPPAAGAASALFVQQAAQQTASRVGGGGGARCQRHSCSTHQPSTHKC